MSDKTVDAPREGSRAAIKALMRARSEQYGHEGAIACALEDLGVPWQLAFEIGRVAYAMGARVKVKP